jgi:HK97 family phage major capsid protein
MRESLRQLMEKRNELITQQRELLDKADEEKRDLTAEELQESEKRDAELDGIEKQVQAQRAGERKPEDVRNIVAPEDVDKPVEEREYKTLAEFRAGELPVKPQDERDYRHAFFKMVMEGRDSLSIDEQRTLSKATAAAGANLVPTEFQRQLIDTLRVYGVMRDISSVMTTTSGDTMQFPSVTSHGTAVWLAENAAFTASDEAFGQLTLGAYKVGTHIIVSEELLTDSAFDLEAYIREQFGLRIGVTENTAYVVGDGSAKPTGVTNGVTAGVTGGAGTGLTVTADDMLSLIHSVIAPYRRNGRFLMNDATLAAIRKLKYSGSGEYIFQPGVASGPPDNIFGYPLYTDPDMPVMAINATSILFGDFRYYQIRDVDGIAFQRLNELFALNGQVGFRAYHRTEGKTLNAAAIKAYKNGAS